MAEAGWQVAGGRNKRLFPWPFKFQFQQMCSTNSPYQLEAVGRAAQTPRYWIAACSGTGRAGVAHGLPCGAWGNDVRFPRLALMVRSALAAHRSSRPPTADRTRRQALLPTTHTRAIDPQTEAPAHICQPLCLKSHSSPPFFLQHPPQQHSLSLSLSTSIFRFSTTTTTTTTTKTITSTQIS